MAHVILRIELTKEERDILERAKDIIDDIWDTFPSDTDIDDYENSRFVTDLCDVCDNFSRH